jgi:hypothetical protein
MASCLLALRILYLVFGFCGVYGLEALSVTIFSSLEHWLVFTTKGHTVGYLVLSWPSIHFSVVVV